MNNKTIKEKYLPPTIEVIEMESEESVMTGSNINGYQPGGGALPSRDRKSTRQNSSHSNASSNPSTSLKC